MSKIGKLAQAKANLKAEKSTNAAAKRAVDASVLAFQGVSEHLKAAAAANDMAAVNVAATELDAAIQELGA
jgi:hypothetical protein